MTANASHPEQLLRPDVAALEPYTPIQPFDVLGRRLGLDPENIVKLDANENPYGPVPAVAEALADFPYYHIYPDPEQTELRAAIGERIGVPEDTVMATHGADEMLDYLCRLLIEPGDAVVNCPPTFGMYRFDAKINGAHVIEVRRDEQFEVDTDAIFRIVGERAERDSSDTGAQVKIVFLTSPNNPSGNWLPDDQLVRFLDLPALIVLDEAYVEFSRHPSRVDWVREYENLVVVRTFSKIAGLAGLRLGYSVCPAWLMPHLWKFKQPYNVNVAATVAGLASLRNQQDIEEVGERIRTERDRLFELLQNCALLEPWPSEANFILCKVLDRSARDLKLELEHRGIMVRHYSSTGLEDCIRISVGRPEHTDRLMAELRSLA